MLFKELKHLMAQIKRDVTCNNCSKSYDESGIVIVGAMNDEVILHLNCSGCGSQSVLNAVLDKYQENRKHSGLKIRNLERANLPEITSNDVIDIHNFLKNFGGDFKKLFSK